MTNNPPALGIFILTFQRDIYLYSYNTLISFCVYVQYISYGIHWKDSCITWNRTAKSIGSRNCCKLFSNDRVNRFGNRDLSNARIFLSFTTYTYDEMLNELGTVCTGKRREIYRRSTDGTRRIRYLLPFTLNESFVLLKFSGSRNRRPLFFLLEILLLWKTRQLLVRKRSFQEATSFVIHM